MSSKQSKAEAKYEKYKEEVLKVKFPYEYHLLTSDLAENLKKLPGQVKQDTRTEYHIVDKDVRSGILFSTKKIY